MRLTIKPRATMARLEPRRTIMKNVMGKWAMALACASLATSAAFAQSMSTPTLKMAGTITAMTIPAGPSPKITIHGTNGSEPCRFVVKSTSGGARGPLAVEVGTRVNFPVTVTWDVGISSTANFQAVGEAAGTIKACQGIAYATFYKAVPPPPEVNP
jgi:type 1 fimbria pilin